MQLSQLNLLIDSGVPILCINAPVQERMAVLKQIYIECAAQKNLPLYLWNIGWGCFKQVKYGLKQNINFSNVEWSNSQLNNEVIFNAFDYLLTSARNGIFIFESLPHLIDGRLPGYYGNFSSSIREWR